MLTRPMCIIDFCNLKHLCSHLNPMEVILGEVIRKVTRFSKVKRGGECIQKECCKTLKGLEKQKTIKFKLGIKHSNGTNC